MQEQIIIAVLGGALPPFIDLLNKHVANSKLRYVFSVLACLLAGGVLAFAQYGNDIWQNAGLIFVASQSVYKMMYQDSKLQTRIR